MESTVIANFFLYGITSIDTPIVSFVLKVKVSNRAVDVNSRALLTCYPRGNFYLMISRVSNISSASFAKRD